MPGKIDKICADKTKQLLQKLCVLVQKPKYWIFIRIVLSVYDVLTQKNKIKKHRNIKVLKINQNCDFSLSYAHSKNVSNKMKAYKNIKALKINQNYAFSKWYAHSKNVAKRIKISKNMSSNSE